MTPVAVKEQKLAIFRIIMGQQMHQLGLKRRKVARHSCHACLVIGTVKTPVFVCMSAVFLELICIILCQRLFLKNPTLRPSSGLLPGGGEKEFQDASNKHQHPGRRSAVPRGGNSPESWVRYQGRAPRHDASMAAKHRTRGPARMRPSIHHRGLGHRESWPSHFLWRRESGSKRGWFHL